MIGITAGIINGYYGIIQPHQKKLLAFRTNKVIVGDFNFLSWDCLSAKSLDGVEFNKYVQKHFL